MAYTKVLDTWYDFVSYIESLGYDSTAGTSSETMTRAEIEAKIQEAIASSSSAVDAQTILQTVYGKNYQNASEVTAIVNQKIAAVIDGAPENMDTLKEVSDWIANHQNLIPTKVSQLTNDAQYTTVAQVNAELVKIDASLGAVNSSISAINTALAGKQPAGNYLTEHQSLAAYATIAQVNAELITIDASIAGVKSRLDVVEGVDHSGFATTTDMQSVEAKANSNTLFLKKLVSELSGRLALVEAKQSSSASQVVASTPEEISAISNPEETSLVVSSDTAVQSMTGSIVYKNIAVVGADTEVSVKLSASDSVSIEGSSINGAKDAGNGKINFSTPNFTVKNTVIEGGSTAYNIFEGEQSTAAGARHTESFTLDNVTVEKPTLTHNVANVYTPTDGAVITIKNSFFNLNVAKSNVLRISNYLNSENVVINFENVDWTYEDAGYDDSDKTWAGLVLFQPAGADVALSGDASKIATWTINLKDCRYNGVKVSAANFGEINSIGYAYNIGGTRATKGIAEYITVNFA